MTIDNFNFVGDISAFLIVGVTCGIQSSGSHG
jgi:hypothetical protein